jgi:hypothetical protein
VEAADHGFLWPGSTQTFVQPVRWGGLGRGGTWPEAVILVIAWPHECHASGFAGRDAGDRLTPNRPRCRGRPPDFSPHVLFGSENLAAGRTGSGMPFGGLW